MPLTWKILLGAMSLMVTSIPSAIFTDLFVERFSNAVYWPRDTKVTYFPDKTLGVKIVEYQRPDNLINALNELDYGRIQKVKLVDGLEHVIMFSDDFVQTVDDNENEYFLRYHTPLFTWKEKEEFITKNSDCLVSGASKNTGEILISLLMINNRLESVSLSKCLHFYYLKLNGFNNALFSDIDSYVIEKNGKVYFNRFSATALKLLKNSNDAQLQSKAEMLRYVSEQEPGNSNSENQ